MAQVVLRGALVLAFMTLAGCRRPEPELVTGCFAAVELPASELARQCGGSQLFVWPMGYNAGDDLLRKYGFAGHLLALPSPEVPTLLDASVRVRLTGRVLKVFPSGVERYVGRAREHELAEALANGKAYLVHATKGDVGWSRALPSRCRAQVAAAAGVPGG